MESLLKDLASPHAISQLVVVMLALFAKDVVVGMLRAYSKRAHTDKDPSNDAVADAADVIANSIEKVSLKK